MAGFFLRTWVTYTFKAPRSFPLRANRPYRLPATWRLFFGCASPAVLPSTSRVLTDAPALRKAHSCANFSSSTI